MSPKHVLLIISLLANQAWASDVPRKQYADVKKFMQDLVSTHPTTARSVTVGRSDSGDTIEGVAIGNGPIHNLVVGTHHGNEYGSTEVSMAFATSIADHPIANQTVYVIPVLNIAGYNVKNLQVVHLMILTVIIPDLVEQKARTDCSPQHP
jgi:hypothetical protein